MKNLATALLILAAINMLGCANKTPPRDSSSEHRSVAGLSVTRDDAISIARKDAQKAIGNLPEYEISATERGHAWHVDFTLKNKTLNGGGLHYEIDKATGKILRKEYEQ